MKINFAGDFYPSKILINKYKNASYLIQKELLEFIQSSDYFFLNLEAPIIDNNRIYR